MSGQPAEPDELAGIRVRAKRQLRNRMRALRLALPAAAIRERSRAVCVRIAALPVCVRAPAVALFWPIAGRGEVDLRELDTALRSAGKKIYYPFMQPRGEVFRTGFRLVTDPTTLVECGRGFCEPPEFAPEAGPNDLDLVIVPALAVAADGHRLGYGAGFYDATLPEYCPPARSIAVAFDFQLLIELPASDDDVACDVIVTDRRVIDVRNVVG